MFEKFDNEANRRKVPGDLVLMTERNQHGRTCVLFDRLLVAPQSAQPSGNFPRFGSVISRGNYSDMALVVSVIPTAMTACSFVMLLLSNGSWAWTWSDMLVLIGRP